MAATRASSPAASTTKARTIPVGFRRGSGLLQQTELAVNHGVENFGMNEPRNRNLHKNSRTSTRTKDGQ